MAGSSSSGGDWRGWQGGDWSWQPASEGGDWRGATCSPPPAYRQGFEDGRAEGMRWGVREGMKWGFEDGQREAQRHAVEPGTWESAKKKKKNRNEIPFTFTVEQMDEEPIYMTAPAHKAVTAYPQEVQEELRKLATCLQDSGDSQQMEYAMTDGGVYNLRLIADSERPLREKYLAKFAVDWVGAQWNKKMTITSPPDSFDEDVSYRPIFLLKKAAPT